MEDKDADDVEEDEIVGTEEAQDDESQKLTCASGEPGLRAASIEKSTSQSAMLVK